MIVSSDSKFWADEEDAIVLREQPATAVYLNGNGAIAIRQERAWDEDDDTLIIIQPENALAVANAMLRLIGAPQVRTVDDSGAQIPPARDRTGADRQRRYRERHRNGTAAVTPVAEPLPLLTSAARSIDDESAE